MYLVVQHAALSEARSSLWMPAAFKTISTHAKPQSLHAQPSVARISPSHVLPTLSCTTLQFEVLLGSGPHQL